MASRNNSRKTFFNRNSLYAKKAEERGINGFLHFASPKFHQLTLDEVASLTTIGHLWTQGDRYYKLAYEHYGNPEYWWIIAWFNEIPTESQLELGDVVYIPVPLEDILGMFYDKE